MTPLLLALKQKKEGMAEVLINMGADTHAADSLGRITLMYAAKCGSELIIRHLFQKGIDANKTDEFGWTPMRYAVESKSKVKKLLTECQEEELRNPKRNSVIAEERTYFGDTGLGAIRLELTWMSLTEDEHS